MKEAKLEVSATITINKTWASNLTTSEICETVRDRLTSSLGFRGDVNRLKVKLDGTQAVYRKGKIAVKPVQRNNMPI